MPTNGKTDVIIIGSGIFGMSTALWMLEDGGYNVLVLDKCGILPAPDAASTDLNKIIRAGDYADPDLARLAVDAVEMWKKPEWEGTYHESGVLALADQDIPSGASFVSSALENCLKMGISAKPLRTRSAIQDRFDEQVPVGTFGCRGGYANPIGGWAEAGRAVEVGIKRIRLLGGVVTGGKEVVGLKKEGRVVNGVVLAGGEVLKGDLVVCAAGAWTPALFTSPGVDARLPPIKATGQSIATIQLSPEEAQTYSTTPVVFCLDNGFYVFPPNPAGLVKFAIHGPGYLNPTQTETNTTVSVPRTKLTPGAEDGMIPLVMLNKLREGLRDIYPELAAKEFTSTRMCWYCDTYTGDWLIDYHPDFDNLVLATGGSGHAFKYAPIIGREILKVVKKEPNPAYAKRWSFGYGDADAGADVRIGEVQVLKLEELATADDLKGPKRVAVTA